ncbi:hypothetical protein LTR91_016222 [Friedmanniomyces endolithicus]|uniref:Formin GTPase-binding domain-containing protein n=1 Tax=Friedmanniomyces endolithicus TaxID=329885 RepID=A0AAN6K8F3_9PEZI|nr:hypothetical protein LTR94_008868 [Friedmanniomyces endolithicus]KAK0791715.1 hypothetical protein LTR38_010149 [Friedmanniomyces endolithicus]KAK0804056.1 hypothetical protein LTR59_004502 [Friedmanniomyces endolithicus]KAK0819079.1 hypothetical protein LTR75_002283 [Friedmanniomyces endolithicus]KAK0851657.1 hypothetical protein LTR03_003914 [Friedmanniomyces endolithicus]
MEAVTSPPPAHRPGHKRNASSKSNLLRAFVSSKSKVAAPEDPQPALRPKSMLFLPPDHPHAGKAKVLGERQGNVQSPPSSPSKQQRSVAAPKASKTTTTTTKVKVKTMDEAGPPKKSKSSTNLSAIFAKMNRSSKDLSATVQKDKENTTPPSSSGGQLDTPIWAQFASPEKGKPSSRPSTRDSKSSSNNVADEIARYTPRDYSPSKQRNFNASLDKPSMRPTLNSRPKSAYVLPTEVWTEAIGRRVSGQRASIEGRLSGETQRKEDQQQHRRVSGDRPVLLKRSHTERKASGSSAEQASVKEKLNVLKRGGRVMAAVAAFQGKSKADQATAQEPGLDPVAVDEAFEAVLQSRQIPEPMRQKMRSLTLRVKADFVKQDLGSKNAGSTPQGSLTGCKDGAHSPEDARKRGSPEDHRSREEDANSTKRSKSRPRSRNFTFSKGDKRGDTSTTKERSKSKTRPISIHIPSDNTAISPATGTPKSPFGSLGRKTAASALPADYIKYLQTNRDATQIEVGRLHKLRILLRNETVAWVDSFLALGGMTEIVGLLHRIMGLEWREEHEDQLFHETLLCLKGLCTTERAMEELAKVADELFPALLGMLFDEEKKGPAEYGTRTVIINVLFTFLASATNNPTETLEHRARRILSYLGEPQKPLSDRPVDFVLDMRTPRPYRLWSREVSNVTREVFWIFLHHLNVVPLPKQTTAPTTLDPSASASSECAASLEATYTPRHFPTSRPPVPAAPYIGGVEWDATTYITAHLDLLNGLLASLPSPSTRNALRAELRASGFEKTMGGTLRTCKEKFYAGVHDGLRGFVGAGWEDGWEVRFVREGPGEGEGRARSGSPAKKRKGGEEEGGPPRLGEVRVEALPALDLGVGGDEGWLG